MEEEGQRELGSAGREPGFRIVGAIGFGGSIGGAVRCGFFFFFFFLTSPRLRHKSRVVSDWPDQPHVWTVAAARKLGL